MQNSWKKRNQLYQTQPMFRFASKGRAVPAALAGAAVALSLSTQTAFSQGCVIARGGGACNMMMHGEADSDEAMAGAFLEKGHWQATIGYRWLHSDRHFRERHEETIRQELGTQVENDSHFIDLTATYAITRQIWVNLTVPFVYSDRSSLYEHDRVNRYHTQAGGLADMRLTGDYWFFDPKEAKRGNAAFGVGLKAPTGDYRATDVFHRASGPQIDYVDSSIQPGDGGWGMVLEAQGFVQVVGDLSAYMNASYLINPRELVPETGYSVPDSYMWRAGLDYLVWPEHGLSLSLGGRIEGVPPKDLVGDNHGFRRPGYAISIEPGVSWVYKRFFASVTTPVAVERNRVRSAYAGTTGDAAFADYTVNATFAYRF
jgi:hypothetical protein